MKKFCQWPFSKINFSNLAFKNLVNDFLILNVNENFKQFINSNYYKAIRKTIYTIENLYATSSRPLESRIF